MGGRRARRWEEREGSEGLRREARERRMVVW